jgi:hypothetical protein
MLKVHPSLGLKLTSIVCRNSQLQLMSTSKQEKERENKQKIHLRRNQLADVQHPFDLSTDTNIFYSQTTACDVTSCACSLQILSRTITTFLGISGKFTFISVRRRVCQYPGKANVSVTSFWFWTQRTKCNENLYSELSLQYTSTVTFLEARAQLSVDPFLSNFSSRPAHQKIVLVWK